MWRRTIALKSWYIMRWYIANIRGDALNATIKVKVFRSYRSRYHSNTCSSTSNRFFLLLHKTSDYFLQMPQGLSTYVLTEWKKRDANLEAHRCGMPCCTLAEGDYSQSLSHGQFCDVTSLILRSADISLLKHTQKKAGRKDWHASDRCVIKQSTTQNQKSKEAKKALTVFQMGAHDCGLRYCSGARRFYSNSLHYTFNSTALYSCLMYDKRYHVRAANSWLKSRKLGVYVDVV